ncbi:hypothetical protein PLICRDRAFT_685581 [Plicaturopsis crispa FD-325 SS-3]|nr:hypothetical protein PLICRDRAFT_685581 [Plicaturopsis crispa FD-325 SS-3]
MSINLGSICRQVSRKTRVRTPLYRRHSTNEPPTYHPKVRAFPFVISPEDALRRMGPYFTFHKDQYTGKWSDSLKALGAQALPFFFDWTPPQPERMQAVYLPVWFMDAEVQARIHDGDDTALAKVQFEHSLPFNHESSAWDLGHKTVHSEFPPSLPFSSALCRQHDTDVDCLPYSISPLVIPDALYNISEEDATIDDQLSFDPSTVDVNLLAAYPVLLPVYIAKYRYEDAVDHSVIADASSHNGWVYGVNNITGEQTTIRNPVFKPLSRLGQALAAPSAQVARFFADNPLSTRDVKDVIIWAASFETPENLQNLATGQPVDMDDLRVRELTDDELKINRNYLKKNARLYECEQIMKTLGDVDPSKIRVFEIPLSFKSNGPKLDTASKLVSIVKDRWSRLKEEQRQSVPPWWKEYLVRKAKS